MAIGREVARWVRQGIEDGLRDRFATKDPMTRGVVGGIYEGVTGRELNLPKRRRPWSMRASSGTPWSFREAGRPRKLLTLKHSKPRPATRGRR